MVREWNNAARSKQGGGMSILETTNWPKFIIWLLIGRFILEAICDIMGWFIPDVLRGMAGFLYSIMMYPVCKKQPTTKGEKK
jgi:hypothetical protein